MKLKIKPNFFSYSNFLVVLFFRLPVLIHDLSINVICQDARDENHIETCYTNK